MSDFGEYNKIHLDVLKEISNIGSSSAVTALSKMINKKLEMKVPIANIVDFKDVANFIGGAENVIVGIYTSFSGEINGMIIFILEYESAKTLLNNVYDRKDKNSDVFDEMELSVLQEIGNIVSSSYLGSLSALINKKAKPSIPSVSIDMANAILSVPAIEFSKSADNVLLIESLFTAENEDISGYFILIPETSSYEIILKSLGVI